VTAINCALTLNFPGVGERYKRKKLPCAKLSDIHSRCTISNSCSKLGRFANANRKNNKKLCYSPAGLTPYVEKDGEEYIEAITDDIFVYCVEGAGEISCVRKSDRTVHHHAR